MRSGARVRHALGRAIAPAFRVVARAPRSSFLSSRPYVRRAAQAAWSLGPSPRRRPLRLPYHCEHDREHNEDLTTENFGCGQRPPRELPDDDHRYPKYDVNEILRPHAQIRTTFTWPKAIRKRLPGLGALSSPLIKGLAIGTLGICTVPPSPVEIVRRPDLPDRRGL
jgi:hypothetical protein